jgi:cobyrinic acid a,c-diamide synthase
LASGLVIAAPRSGSGKTLVTLGLIAALRRRGLLVAPAKTGPDYIDRAILARTAGSEAINLDPWAMAPTRLRQLAAGHAEGADLLLVEGVMGLFDGAASGTGSTADLAQLLGLPVILVVDADRQSQSIAALVHGFASFRPGLPIAGLILNRCASPRHEAMLRSALAPLGLPIIGALPRDPALTLPERHLGLVLPDEIAAFDAVISTAAATLATHLDLTLLLTLASPEPPAPPSLPLVGRAGVGVSDPPPPPSLPLVGRAGVGVREPPASPSLLPVGRVGVGVSEPPPSPPLLPLREKVPEGRMRGGEPQPLPPLGQHIAIARDDAFAFLYPHWLIGWRQSGASVSFFSPLADEIPHPDADAIFLPGGYPELHAGRLSAQQKFMAAAHTNVEKGLLFYGECGGFMVMGETLTDRDGVTHRMLGLLPLHTRIDRPRRVLGYRQLTHDSRLPWPKSLHGHEFHYSTAAHARSVPALFSATDALGGQLPPMGMALGNVLGSYVHVIDIA